MKVITIGSMTISLVLGKLMKSSLRPGTRRSFKYLIFRDNLSILYEDLLNPVDFSILIELNGGFDIDVSFFALLMRAVWVQGTAQLLDTLWGDFERRLGMLGQEGLSQEPQGQ